MGYIELWFAEQRRLRRGVQHPSARSHPRCRRTSGDPAEWKQRCSASFLQMPLGEASKLGLPSRVPPRLRSPAASSMATHHQSRAQRQQPCRRDASGVFRRRSTRLPSPVLYAPQRQRASMAQSASPSSETSPSVPSNAIASPCTPPPARINAQTRSGTSFGGHSAA